MRALFLLLVLLNLGYFTWQWQQPSDIKPPASSLPLAVAPNTKTLTLLSEIRTAPGTATESAPGDSPQETTPPSPPAANP